MSQNRGKLSNRAWHPEDIKAAVRKDYGSLANLARLSGVSESVVQTAVSRPQPTGNRIIATALGLSVHEIWPQWFDVAGNIVADTGKRKSCRSHAARQKSAAA